MCSNIQPTCSALNNRFPISSLNCFLFNNALETIEHLFLHCDWVVQLWLLAPWPLYMSKLSSLSILDWIKVILNPKSMMGLNEESVKDFQLYATILCDHLWMARNKARVEGSKSNPTYLSRQIFSVFVEHKEAWKEQNERSSKDVVWSPPPRS